MKTCPFLTSNDAENNCFPSKGDCEICEISSRINSKNTESVFIDNNNIDF